MKCRFIDKAEGIVKIADIRVYANDAAMTSASNHRNHSRSRRSNAGRSGVARSDRWQLSSLRASPNLTAITLVWLAALLLGGSSRGDVTQLILLRPLAVLGVAYGLWTVQWQQVSQHRFIMTWAAAILALVLLHLAPLPPSLWTALPGRELIVDLDQNLDLDGAWRPLTMAPAFTWNAMFALAVPLAVLLNGIQLRNDDLLRVGFLIIAGGVASSVLAFFQLFSTPNGILYFYSARLVQPEAVGFFANRNHQALLVAAMFPLLAAYAARRGISATDDRRRLVAALALSLFFFPLLIVTGSRAGLVVGALGVMSAPFIYLRGARVRSSDHLRAKTWRWLIGVITVLGIAGVFIATDRSTAVQRVLNTFSENDQRYVSWSVIADNYDRFMPFGSGAGSYQPVFQVIEPRTALTDLYSNHAHNDWLEVVMTVGVPGVVMLALAIAAFAWAAWRHFRLRERGPLAAYQLAGLVIILLVAIASAVDYPVRTPIIASLFVMACLWATADCRALVNDKDRGGDRRD